MTFFSIAKIFCLKVKGLWQPSKGFILNRIDTFSVRPTLLLADLRNSTFGTGYDTALIAQLC